MKTGLPHDGHVQMVNQGHLEALRALVVVAVVKGLDVEEHGVAIVLARFGPLQGDELYMQHIREKVKERSLHVTKLNEGRGRKR